MDQRQSVNSVDGNTLVWMYEQDKEKDLYYCGYCKDFVTEDSWNQAHNICYRCWFNN